MWQILISIIAFFITVTILIAVHEYGHFIAARLSGVKVLKFSIGFGKPLFRWFDRNQTEYAIGCIPFGGYLKMLHEDDAGSGAKKSEVFEKRNPLIKMFIVFAGPLFNFIFAILALWLMYIIGIQTVLPFVGYVRPHSPAAVVGLKSGQRIVAVNEVKTNSWMAVRAALIQHGTNKDALRLKVLNPVKRQYYLYKIPLSVGEKTTQPGLLAHLGIEPKIPQIPPAIHKVVPNGAADIAGLKNGDFILSVNQKPLHDFNTLTEMLIQHPSRILHLVVRRQGKKMDVQVKPKVQTLRNGQKVGYLGIQSGLIKWPKNMLYTEHHVWWKAVIPAIQHVWTMSSVSVHMLFKMVTGRLSWKYLGGPVSIARMAGVSMSSGLIYFLQFLALISVSIGIINLLPIPVLDGGYLVYYMAELILRRPLSKRVQHIGLQIGIVVLFLLVMLALFNDVVRF